MKTKQVITPDEIDQMSSSKIRSIDRSVGNFGKSMQFKIMKEKNMIIVVTREGLLKYMGNAQYAFGWGVKNIHYKEFKNSCDAAKYINENINN